MNTIDWLVVLPGLLGGFAIGLAFFGSLRWTVDRLSQVQKPTMFFLGSFLLRTGGALLGFYLLAAGSWQRLLLALVGFFIARVTLVNLFTFRDERLSGEANS